MPIRKTLATSLFQKIRTTDFWIHAFLYGCLLTSLFPITVWVATTADEQSRILHALIVLLAACVLLVRFGNVEIRAPLSLNHSARTYLYAAFGLMFASMIAHSILPQQSSTIAFLLQLISIPAYCCALGSLVLFIFGEATKRITGTVAGTFCLFLFLSIFMQPLDWPLRSLAGQWSGAMLNLLGKTVEYGVQADTETGAPQLLMLVNGQPFHVASECNGFGVILTSLLIAFMLGIYRKLSLFDIGLNLVAGILLGFIFNTIRIVVIVLLAPHMMEHYLLMHEIIGTVSYWSCLALIWVLLNGPTKDTPEAQ